MPPGLLNPFIFGAGAAATLDSEMLADVPVRYYRCQETAGTTLVDASGNAGDGSIANGAVVNDGSFPAPPAGVGKYIKLDGSNDYLTLDAANWFAPSGVGFTLEGWYYQSMTQAYPRYFDLQTVAGGLDVELSRNNLDTQFRLDCAGGTGLWSTASPNGAWHHIVLTVTSGGTATLYIDGTSQGTQTVGAPTNTNRVNKWVGRSGTSGSGDPFFQGAVSRLAVYHSALSAGRVTAHWAARASA